MRADLDQFLGRDLEAPVDIVPDDFALPDGVDRPTRYESVSYKYYILYLKGGTGI